MVTVKVSGGDRLRTALAEIARKVGRGQVKVGFFAGSNYEDGTSVAYVAAIQEFGTTEAGANGLVIIPPRPFMRNTIANNKAQWSGQLAEALKAADYDGTKALGFLGTKIAKSRCRPR